MFRYLDNSELKEIFETKEEIRAVRYSEEIAETISNVPDASAQLHLVFAFLARIHDLNDEQVFQDLGAEQPVFSSFVRDAEMGLEKYLAQRKGVLANVDISIEIDNVRPVSELGSEENDFTLRDANRVFTTRRQSPGLSPEQLEDVRKAWTRRVRKDMDSYTESKSDSEE